MELIEETLCLLMTSPNGQFHKTYDRIEHKIARVQLRRRAFIFGAITTITVPLSGCTLDQDPIQSGTLVIANDHDQPHTVTVTVSKTSEDDNDAPFRDDTQPPEAPSIWDRTDEFDVAAGGRVRKSTFISETGAFHIVVQLEIGINASTWLGLGPGGPSGEQVTGGFILVDIHEDGRLGLNTPVDD
ncbi:hypothetical protein ACFQH3_16045 [Haladaptatus sp. GCM10025707]|uniref:hypothetical protein n=1 Tax=unclassified Haladaptatus TaxID=2622732 RepID=UPI0023E8F772|nr:MULTISPECIES: hypothetical protein [unclassified Haladaptatus]